MTTMPLYLPQGLAAPSLPLSLSPEAHELENLLVSPRVQSSSSLSWAQAGTLGELVNAAAEALDAGGERAKLERSVYWAAVFLSQLPLSASPPDVSIEDSGSVTFDWDRGARRVFAVRFSSDENLHYAGLFGTEAIHGSEPASQVTPLAILKGIERVVSEARHYSNPE